MDLKGWKDKLNNGFQKYRYAALIVLVGIVLMMIPGRSESNDGAEPVSKVTETQLPLNEELEQVLSQVNGAGRVQVMLTQAEGPRTIYQTDQNSSVSENSTNTQTDTVTVTDDQRQQEGLIQQINPPIYLGAIVVCEGADSPAVRLAIVEAVSKVTGLGADRISVLKMK